jgi:hypothetical protein
MKIIGNMRTVGVGLLAVGLVCLVIGGVFVQQSFMVKTQLLDAVKAQRITSSGVQEYFDLDENALYNPPITVVAPTGTATAPITKTVFASPTVLAPSGTRTAPVTTSVVIPPGTVVVLDQKIEGIIDTPKEVSLMADTLMAHLLVGYVPYSATSSSDPARATIVQAMSMLASLNLARMGFGVSTIALGAGAFMIVVGLGFDLLGLYLWRGRSSG